jgi:hypothetical protein
MKEAGCGEGESCKGRFVKVVEICILSTKTEEEFG